MKPRVCVLSLFVGLVLAQGPPRPGRGPGGMAPRVDEIKSYLTLTDVQLTQIQQLQRANLEAGRATREEIQQKQKALGDQLRSGSADATAIGRLLLDIENLRKQTATRRAMTLTQIANLLTPDQQTKLKTLEDAAALRDEIGQAARLGLLDPPNGDGGADPRPAFRPGRFGPPGRQ